MSYRQPFFKRMDPGTLRGLFNYLFEKTGFDQYDYLLMRTDIPNRHTMESLFMLNVLRVALKSRGAMIGASVLEGELISRNREGRKEAVQGMIGNLPTEERIRVGKDTTAIKKDEK